MHGTVAFPLPTWEAYYVIVGTTAGALTGLQFVVLTLITEAGRLRGSKDTFAAFGSPNIVHFCAALLVSALFSAPWPSLGPPGVAVAGVGACGVVYSITVLRRALRQRDYRPVMEDWVWHAALPILTYAALAVAGIRLPRASADPPFIVGGATLLLVLIGIHNAWDTVTYVALDRARRRDRAAAAGERPSAPGSAPATGKAMERSGPPPPRNP